MHVVVLGGSGFIGSALVKELILRKNTVSVSSNRSLPLSTPSVSFFLWDGLSTDPLSQILDGSDAVVNLVGENIASKRWTTTRKQILIDSRIQAGETLTGIFKKLKKLPSVFIQASATGYYGCWQDYEEAPECTESSPPGTGFLAQTTIDWEASTGSLEALGVRRCVIRTAPVLGASGGFLKKMLPTFSFGLGNIFGSGNQPFPWIHLYDEVAAIIFLLENKNLRGVFNLVSPEQITMKYFAYTLGKVLNRPVIIHVPSVILNILLGEMAKELLLSGQKVYPEALLNHGFTFAYSSLPLALQQVLGKK